VIVISSLYNILHISEEFYCSHFEHLNWLRCYCTDSLTGDNSTTFAVCLSVVTFQNRWFHFCSSNVKWYCSSHCLSDAALWSF